MFFNLFIYLLIILNELDSQIRDHRMKLAEEVVAFQHSNSVDCIWNWNVNVAAWKVRHHPIM